jgi:hypothetical protein
MSAHDHNAEVSALLLEVLTAQRAILDELREMRREHDELRADRRPRGRCSREDLQTLRKLLPAIGGARGSEPFTTEDLGQNLAIRALVAHLSARQLGRLFLRAVAVDGYAVERVGLDRNRALWRVVAIPNVGFKTDIRSKARGARAAIGPVKTRRSSKP